MQSYFGNTKKLPIFAPLSENTPGSSARRTDIDLSPNYKQGDSVAQQVEHIPFKDGVLGSSPSWITN